MTNAVLNRIPCYTLEVAELDGELSLLLFGYLGDVKECMEYAGALDHC